MSCGAPGRRAFGLGLLAGATSCAAPRGAAPARPLEIEETPPATGPLRLLGGLVLDTGVIGFGGLSGLHLGPDLHLAAVSDAGRWLTARLVLEGGRPTGLSELRTGRLRDGAGRPLPRGHPGDAESLARLPDGSWLVGFERWHRIRAYRTLDSPGVYMEAPPGLEYAPYNGGLEALAVLSDGSVLAITEALDAAEAPDSRRAWLRGPRGWTPMAYRPAPGFRPVDAAPLPGGGALVLERRFSLLGGFGGRLVRLADLTRPVLDGEELLRLEPPLPTDNWEAVGAARADGRTLVAVLSDDNGMFLQRSMLLLFELKP